MRLITIADLFDPVIGPSSMTRRWIRSGCSASTLAALPSSPFSREKRSTASPEKAVAGGSSGGAERILRMRLISTALLLLPVKKPSLTTLCWISGVCSRKAAAAEASN